jgi:hypothetical protein
MDKRTKGMLVLVQIAALVVYVPSLIKKQINGPPDRVVLCDVAF